MSLKLLLIVLLLCISYDSVISSEATTTTTTTTKPSELDSCYQICSKTYTLHTYPQSEHLNACNLGCRFNILSDMASRTDTNRTRTECLNACSLHFKETEYYACSIGCNNTQKVQFSREDTEDTDQETNNENNNQLFMSPFHMIRSLFDSVYNRGSIIVERSSINVYLSRNSDGESKLIVVQSEPEVVVHQYPELMQSNEYESESVTGSEERTTTDYKPRVDLAMWTNENPLLVHHPKQTENSWSNCFGYQSGVPRWILASVLFLAIFVLAWICCATTATAPEQHIRRRVGMGSDLKYLCLYDEPIKLVINDKPPSYQELQAEQLPQKTSIDNQSIP